MDAQQVIRVMVVDDHDLFRDGIVSVIRSQPDMDVVGEAGDGLEALVMAQSLLPDVILMDINMPGTDGLEATQQIAQKLPDCKIVMLTVRDEDERIFEAIRNGAQGYLLKTIRAHQLMEMIRAVARGEAAMTPSIAARVMAEFRRQSSSGAAPSAPSSATTPSSEFDDLTWREHDVLRLITEGLTDKEIAASLDISLYTVKSHVRNILAKLHVNNRREAAQLSYRKSSQRSDA
ncbi:MAG: response regulator transcription factor [Chloroflexales bacterium]|nr:response regulator transcription factor [Chloroflexales bacterium]